jgi:1,4-alpha-glucan branching enzyme
MQRAIEPPASLLTGKKLHELDFNAQGFEWIDAADSDQSTLSYLRRSAAGEMLAVVCNFTPVPRHNYRVGVPAGGCWSEVLNSDALMYGGSGLGNSGHVDAAPVPAHGRYHSLMLTLPPLGVLVLAPPKPVDSKPVPMVDE